MRLTLVRRGLCAWASATLVAGAVLTAGAAQARELESDAGPVQVETVASGLERPWGLDFLPDGRMLVTERSGQLRLVAGSASGAASASGADVSEPIAGVPEVYARDQGGLLDVAIDPDFAANRLVYLSYAEAGDGGVSTAVARGRLNEQATALEDVEVIFRQQPKMSGGKHFGSRLAFAPDGTLFITLGDRFKFEPAQDLGNHVGTIVRINPDGTVPADNPFVGREGALPEIWSYGHRNVQGAAIHPETGALWSHEFGPRGGDELNRPEAGRNYGWPLVSWGRHYSGEGITDPPARPDLADAVRHWTPVISPSGMIFYTGDLFEDWRGDILIGGLSARALVRLELDGDRVMDEERLDLGERIRNVRQSPDGAVYLLTDQSDGEILKLTPAGG